eukprot:TRINITY_DN15752_c0_g1_i1.p2 TRINITY_DN15752_c0_g1~~TRINITY_DN15752_c0_g1_i1.p2  ORF type:complete len:145 (+),score=20.94 TRINITY_DN15752_c0_g1_i1:103-537(+)
MEFGKEKTQRVILENGNKARLTVMVSIFGAMETDMKESGKPVQSMVMGLTYLPMEIFIQVNISKGSQMEMANIFGQVEPHIWGNSKMEKSMEWENGKSQEITNAIIMKDNIIWIRKTVMEYLNGQVVMYFVDNIKMMKEKELEK